MSGKTFTCAGEQKKNNNNHTHRNTTRKVRSLELVLSKQLVYFEFAMALANACEFDRLDGFEPVFTLSALVVFEFVFGIRPIVDRICKGMQCILN